MGISDLIYSSAKIKKLSRNELEQFLAEIVLEHFLPETDRFSNGMVADALYGAIDLFGNEDVIKQILEEK